MEIQQMGFDGKRFCSKRGPVADVGHRIKTFFATRVRVMYTPSFGTSSS